MKFTITEVLFYYDGPIMVRGLTEANEPVLACVVDEKNRDMIWVAVQVSTETMDGILANKIELRDAYTIHRIGPVYTGENIGCEDDVATVTDFGIGMPEEWLPNEGCYLSYD